MKIIDLLNMISKGEEVPNKIKIGTHIFTKYNYSKGDGTFVPSYESNNDGEYYINDFLYPQYLNDEVEILEEEKKIPERVLNAEVFDVPKLNNMELSNIALTNKEDIKIIKDTLNKVLDYLKSKGDE